jgi:tetratricopeptide (TPR) repeat protein
LLYFVCARQRVSAVHFSPARTAADGDWKMAVLIRKFKKYAIFIVGVAILLTAGPFWRGEARAQGDGKSLEQLQVLQCLNQIAVSLTHIMNYNDKVVLDQEYNNIINNLNLSKIPDADIITLLQELMDLLTSSKIQEHERAYLMRNYEKNIQEELKKRLRSRIFDTDLVLNPYTTVLNAMLNVGSFYFNYRSQIDQYRKEEDEKAWQIEAKTLEGLNQFYKKLLKYSWDLMRRYNFPDEWRLDEKQLSTYTAILKEGDPELRYRKLERIERSFQKFPPYWYYRGQTAMDIGRRDEALRCFDQFQSIHQGIFRKDPYAASTAMCRTMLAGEAASPDAIRKDLERILANSDDADWSNILFAAMQYARLGDAETAGKLILRNLDNGHTAFIESPDMIRAVGPALLLNARPDVFDRVMEDVLEQDKVKNYDVLWLYQEMRNRDILKKIEPEFNRVLLLSENKSHLNPLNLFKGDNLSLFLPTRWVVDNLDVTLRLTGERGELKFRADEMVVLPHHPEMTVLKFEDVLSIESIVEKDRFVEIAVALVHEKLPLDQTEKEKYDIEMFFTSEILSAESHLNKIITYSKPILAPADGREAPSPAGGQEKAADVGHGKADDDDEAVWFAKEQIVINGEVFRWSDDGILFK